MIATRYSIFDTRFSMNYQQDGILLSSTAHPAPGIFQFRILDLGYRIKGHPLSPAPYALCLVPFVPSIQHPVSSIYSRISGFYLTYIDKKSSILDFETPILWPISTPWPPGPISSSFRPGLHSGLFESFQFFQAAMRCLLFVWLAESFGLNPG